MISRSNRIKIIIGSCYFILFLLTLYFIVLKPLNIVNYLLKFSPPAIGILNLSPISSNHSGYYQSWYLASLFVNFISLIAMIILWGFDPDKKLTQRAFFVIGLGLGFLCALNAIFLFFINYDSKFWHAIIICIFFLYYVAVDIFGGLKTNWDKKYKYPLCCTDLPPLIVTSFFIYYTFRDQTVTHDFLSGISASLLISTNVIFAAIWLVILPEQKKPRRLKK